MRKQYHFQPSKNGYYAWDVDKLIALSTSLPRILVRLSDIIELDQTYWYNEPDSRPTVRSVAEHCKLINEADLQFPIILSKDGKVMDGMHRVAKAFQSGLTEVLAVKFSGEVPPDFEDVQAQDLSY